MLLATAAASGCLRYEMRATIQHGGLTSATLAFNAPAWAYKAMGLGAPLKMPASQAEFDKMMAESELLQTFAQRPLLAVRAGEEEGSWQMLAPTPSVLSTPILTYNYEETDEGWTYAAKVSMPPGAMTQLREQVEARLAFLPRLGQQRRSKMVEGMLRQAQIDIAMRFPTDANNHNGDEASGQAVRWLIPMSDLANYEMAQQDAQAPMANTDAVVHEYTSNAPNGVMFAKGTFGPRDNRLRAIYSWLPAPEMD